MFVSTYILIQSSGFRCQEAGAASPGVCCCLVAGDWITKKKAGNNLLFIINCN